MNEITSGTSGCDTGANGVRRKLALAMVAGFALILTFITIANAESLISDFRAAGVRETAAHVWTWELTSIVAWLSLTPAIWWGVAHIRPPRWSWPVTAALFVVGLFIASAWHIGLMIVLRNLVYALQSSRYHFEGGISNPYVYEFRKDIGTYLQFTTLAMLCQWLLARVGASVPAAAEESGRFVAVNDGAITHQVPVDDIVQIVAAGNYVEIERDGRSLLHRATLATMETELGTRFVRIHRSRLVNRDAIRRIETNQSGDFEVVLSDGSVAKGSRRYRAGLEQRL
jgi:hypothetical protein